VGEVVIGKRMVTQFQNACNIVTVSLSTFYVPLWLNHHLYDKQEYEGSELISRFLEKHGF